MSCEFFAAAFAFAAAVCFLLGGVEVVDGVVVVREVGVEVDVVDGDEEEGWAMGWVRSQL